MQPAAAVVAQSFNVFANFAQSFNVSLQCNKSIYSLTSLGFLPGFLEAAALVAQF